MVDNSSSFEVCSDSQYDGAQLHKMAMRDYNVIQDL